MYSRGKWFQIKKTPFEASTLKKIDTNKFKTREELVAEERDYERRRTSYRSKKLKRNTTEVMRDIIGEYMEEIKQAGVIGSMSKTAEEADASASEYSYRHESATVVSGSRNYQATLYHEGQLHDNGNEFHSRYGSEDFMDGVQAQRRDSSWYIGLRDPNRNTVRVGRDRDDYSRSHEERLIGVNHKNRWVVEKGPIMWKSSKNVIPHNHVERHMNGETVIEKREARVTKSVVKERDMIEGKAKQAGIVETEKKTEMSIGTEGEARQTGILEIERKTITGIWTEGEAK
ncbi:uncharacterized protein [Primulina huaijiensis]|uniref:uncharacterized protein n=1 Tax=Primulina huaijiensis TaxID=1492673 RepID=UPI003CC766E5